MTLTFTKGSSLQENRTCAIVFVIEERKVCKICDYAREMTARKSCRNCTYGFLSICSSCAEWSIFAIECLLFYIAVSYAILFIIGSHAKVLMYKTLDFCRSIIKLFGTLLHVTKHSAFETEQDLAVFLCFPD